MKEFNFDSRTQFKVKWQGKEHICQRPSQRQVMEFGAALDKIDNEPQKAVDLSKEFLETCGLPQEVYEELEVSQIQELMEYISAKKK